MERKRLIALVFTICLSSSDALRIGTGDDLFNFLADCVLDFLKSEGMEKDEFSLGEYIS